MDIRITVRRGRAGEAFRAAAEEKARKLERFEPRLSRVELILEGGTGRVSAEVRSSVPGLPTLVARAEADSRRSALGRVMTRSARQLRKERSRRVEHQAPPITALIE